MKSDIEALMVMGATTWDKNFHCAVASCGGSDCYSKFGDGTVLGRASVGIYACDRTSKGELELGVEGWGDTSDDLHRTEGSVKGLVEVRSGVGSCRPRFHGIIPPRWTEGSLICENGADTLDEGLNISFNEVLFLMCDGGWIEDDVTRAEMGDDGCVVLSGSGVGADASDDMAVG